MKAVVLVGLGGAAGSIARYLMAIAAARWLGTAFPWGTIGINIVGSFIIGWFAVFSEPRGAWPASETTRAFVMAGLCGGFTTFSAFSLQTVDLLRSGAPGRAVANIGLSVLLCLAATFFGMRLGQG